MGHHVSEHREHPLRALHPRARKHLTCRIRDAAERRGRNARAPLLLPRRPREAIAGRVGDRQRMTATLWVESTGANNGRSTALVPGPNTEKPCRRADRCHCMEPATAHDRSTTHAPARTLRRPAPANIHEPGGHMEATSAGTAEPRQARVCHSNQPNRDEAAHPPP